MDQNKHPFDPCHLGVLLGVRKKISMHMVHLMQTVYLSCAEISTFSKQTQTSFHLTRVTKEYHLVSKMISKPVVRSVQTFHLTHVT
jgi:hypothetical protein